MPAKICCDQCNEDIDIRYKNAVYCGKCYDTVVDQLEWLEHPSVVRFKCRCVVDFDCDIGYCEDCYEDLKEENKKLKEEVSRLQKIVSQAPPAKSGGLLAGEDKKVTCLRCNYDININSELVVCEICGRYYESVIESLKDLRK